MKSAEQAIAKSAPAVSSRASSVQMGRQDYLSVLFRLIGMELYKLHRRLMSKVLYGISIISTVGTFALIALATLLVTKNDTPAQVIRNFSDPLRLPYALSVMSQLLLTLGLILIVVLVSTIVGGEYIDKTVRLMFTRGPSRAQFLLAKVGAALVCIIIGVLGLTLLGVIAGLLLNFTTNIPYDMSFFNAAWLGHALLYLAAIMLGLFVYAMMALCLSTLGRTTAAGMAGVLVWSFLIENLISIIALIGRSLSGVAGSFFQALPDYVIGTNISALLQNQYQYLVQTAPFATNPVPSDVHALAVLAAYLVLFIGLSWWVTIRRDVLH